MKKQIARSMDIDRIPVQRLTALLETFTLKHSARSLADLLEKAEVNELSYREFLLTLLETEVRGRNERRRKRNLSAALATSSREIPFLYFSLISLNLFMLPPCPVFPGYMAAEGVGPSMPAGFQRWEGSLSSARSSRNTAKKNGLP